MGVRDGKVRLVAKMFECDKPGSGVNDDLVYDFATAGELFMAAGQWMHEEFGYDDYRIEGVQWREDVGSMGLQIFYEDPRFDNG